MMIETMSALRDFGIHANDGDIGKIVDVFFDDETWTARYFVVETGGWLRKRRVLISPIAVVGLDEDARSVTVDLTLDQIAQSPPVDTEHPVSRQMELKYLDYFAWPVYWVETFVEAYKKPELPQLVARRERLFPRPPQADPHLRSANKIVGYMIMASNGSVGQLEDILLDSDDGWAISSFVIHANELAGDPRRLLPVGLIHDISWSTSAIHVRLARGELGNLPAYVADKE